MTEATTPEPHDRTAPAHTEAAGLLIRVDDMTCGGCAGAVTRAIESGLAGAKADADPVSKTVRVRGTENADAVRALIQDAGYTPAWG